MNRPVVHGQRRFSQRFGERGVGMKRAGDVLAAGRVFHGDRGFGQKIARPRTHDVNAQHPVGVRVGEHFDEAVVLSASARPLALRVALPFLYGIEAALRNSSVLPTQAISGSV